MIKARVSVHADLPELVFGFQIKDRLGQQVFGTNTYLMQQQINNVKASELLEFVWYFSANIGEGSYAISFALHIAHGHPSIL
jgi:lipopolysaccharide transport system ATP-binding protein